jgi:hypothetical protein
MEEEGPVPERGEEQQGVVPLPLPAAFLEFLSENGLDPAVYSMAATIPRYIRWLLCSTLSRIMLCFPVVVATSGRGSLISFLF